ncbi:MAG: flippase-like domain-containing protein [Bacteroidaceae bacterium]|nr:flippase-like domain-containing protein [Bacteroidaceae bacterium]
MYRGFEWGEVNRALRSDMRWSWMLWSLPFGVLAQVFRALRWRQALEPMGEHPRRHTAICAIFLSYASSLVIPRVGEILRCGVLRQYDRTNFGRSVGTVVCERVVDTVLMLLLTAVTIVWQIPVFLRFMETTGVSLSGILHGFTPTGYAVTAMCGLAALALVTWILAKLHVLERTRQMVKDMLDGLLSIRQVRHKWLFLLYSVGIWVAYYLHFYLTFFCFDFTENLGPMAALVAFVVGSFAVLVPTPNGAGPWHFAVKTVLVLYGVAGVSAAMFVLVVHTIQTLLVLLLGLYALAALAFVKPRR